MAKSVDKSCVLYTFIGEHVANIGVDTAGGIVWDTDGFGDSKVRWCDAVVVSGRRVHRVFVFVEGRHGINWDR